MQQALLDEGVTLDKKVGSLKKIQCKFLWLESKEEALQEIQFSKMPFLYHFDSGVERPVEVTSLQLNQSKIILQFYFTVEQNTK